MVYIGKRRVVTLKEPPRKLEETSCVGPRRSRVSKGAHKKLYECIFVTPTNYRTLKEPPEKFGDTSNVLITLFKVSKELPKK